jgi:arylsulfatase A-like enzyme
VISDRDPIQREAVYFEFTHDLRPDSGFHNHFWRAVRTEEWTYVVKGDEAGSEPWLLYNRRTDPWELRNLLDAGSSDVSSSVTKVATTLHRQLALEHRESLDHFVLSSSFGVPGANEWETFLQ